MTSFLPILKLLKQWLLLATIVGVLAGSASALFLVLLEWATAFRETHLWILWFLPVGGFLLGWSYQKVGQKTDDGNIILLDQIEERNQRHLPLIMAPLALLTAVLTHLIGGSAGREGTAVQMGGALADQLVPRFVRSPLERRLLLICGISAGFASIFGTPLAGIVFSLEVIRVPGLRWKALAPAVIAALVADAVTTAWGVGHTQYPTIDVDPLNTSIIGNVLVAGMVFGLGARIFMWALRKVKTAASTLISVPALRPAVGGVLLMILLWQVGTTKYIGLGIPTILSAFDSPLPWYDFAAKIIFTAITLGSGFKGGEVTPLFYIGATLGNALTPWLSLPVTLLAALGFVAVFAGASKTPLACTFMAMELFGPECGLVAGLACFLASMVSGGTGIYYHNPAEEGGSDAKSSFTF